MIGTESASAAAQQRRFTRENAHLWVRPDADRFVRPDARLYMQPAAYERWLREREAKAAERASDAEREAEHKALLQLKAETAALRAEVRFQKLLAALKAYDPNQPRVPVGNPDGGQWTSGGSTSRDEMDFSAARRTRGHHFVHQSLYRDLPLRPETRQIFESATTGPLHAQRHGWSKEHLEYNKAVAEHFDRFVKSQGVRLEEMTPAQARSFVQEIRRSHDPRIRSFNIRILREEFRYFLRRIPRSSE